MDSERLVQGTASECSTPRLSSWLFLWHIPPVSLRWTLLSALTPPPATAATTRNGPAGMVPGQLRGVAPWFPWPTWSFVR